MKTAGPPPREDGPVLGIDLGTRYALCAVFDGVQGPVVVPNRWGKRSTPSVTAWTGSGWTAGETAAAGEMKHPSTTWWDLKRKVGTPWKGRCGRASVSAEDALVPLLTLLREDGEAFLGAFVEACVLAVPASFSFAERSAMARAARSAGFSRSRIVNEPTAAALAFGSSGRFLILDYGAGTVDLSVGGVRRRGLAGYREQGNSLLRRPGFRRRPGTAPCGKDRHEPRRSGFAPLPPSAL